MTPSNLQRRSFHKLSAAALGGLVAGAGATQASAAQGAKEEELTVDPALLASEPHVCRGLNTCKGKGATGENACAGQGNCSAVEKHACNGQNECKGQGGCGGYPGQNTCDAKGHCAVPLKKQVWERARMQFEEVMKDKGTKVGPAPKA